MAFFVGAHEFDSQETFIRSGRRCGTPSLNDFQKARIRSHMASLRASGFTRAAAPPIAVPVHMHVIHHGSEGDVTDAQLDRQLDVLNDCYGLHHIVFTRIAVDRTDNPAWFRMTMGSAAERQAKQQLGTDTHARLNLYIAGIGAGLLGWATFPSDLAGDPARDGVVVLDASLPGGAAAPYNQGKTAVHEVGHWLGLYHTFENACHAPGDEVDDTPYEATPNFGPANPLRNSCSQGGTDPTRNFMDYTDDAGMTEFTSGQIERIGQQLALYRPMLLSAAAVTTTAQAAIAADLFTGAF